MDILCITGLFPLEYAATIEKDSKCSVQNAANKLQWGVVEGLCQQENIHVQICNSLYVGAYPKRYRKWHIPTFSFSYGGETHTNVGFINLPFVKIFSRYFGVKNGVDRWYRAHKDSQEKAVILYALTTPFTWIARYISKRYNDVKVCVVVPDLPEYMNVSAMQKRGLYYYLKTAEIAMIRKCIQNVEYYVLLTDAMKTWFHKRIQYTVVEAVAHPENIVEKELCDEENREMHMLYAGGIKREYGVSELVSAFCRIDEPGWVLDIYGDGADMAYVKSLAKENPNVVFHGMVSNSQVVKAQRQADLLVNPRKNQPMAEYSFPSKILEYMSSGTPMLGYKLSGVPQEYDAFYYPISTDDDGMETSLSEAMRLPNAVLWEKGKQAQLFVQENKLPQKQCKKIVCLLQQGDCVYEGE